MRTIALALCCCLVRCPAQVPRHVDWIKHVGGCKVTHFSNGDSNAVPNEAVVIRTRTGKLIANITGAYVLFEAADVTGDGARDAIVTVTGRWGTGKEFYVYVFRLGKSPKNLLVFGESQLRMFGKPRDVNGDGVCELALGDDRLGEYPSCDANQAGFPVYLECRHGRFVDVTRRCVGALRRDLAAAMRRFRTWLDHGHAEPSPDPKSIFPPSMYPPDDVGPPVECYAISVLCGPRTERTTWRTLMHALPQCYYPWMKRMRAGIKAKARASTQCIRPTKPLPVVVSLPD